MESGGNHYTSFLGSSPCGVTQDMLNSSTNKLWTTCGCSFREAHQRHRGLVMYSLNIPKSQVPRRKAGVQHKPHCTEHWYTVSYSLQGGDGREPPWNPFSRCQLRPNLQADLFEDSSPRPTMLNSLLHSHLRHNSVKNCDVPPTPCIREGLEEVGDIYFGCWQRMPWDNLCIGLPGWVRTTCLLD